MGRIQQPAWRLDGFRQVNFYELHDLGYIGNKFTCERGRGTNGSVSGYSPCNGLLAHTIQ
ncbi:hypothetical protein KY290_010841 [Solanum tuberosum]|uniref:Uncharacterized protein n=1 Tax=Solanum tuberosum TaxID=4113 RepID=A0ABQ7VZ00_SOLTU|nr:hypothetical protein KY290_010841 [Solanum tuberosum]